MRLYRYNPVGAVKGPYGYQEATLGPMMFEGGPMRIPARSRFGDIVVNSDEDVVIANSEASFDQLQDGYQDDQITSGDEGLGYAQAKRLKGKLRRNGRRLTTRGYAVEANAPYNFGVEANAPYNFGVEAWSPYQFGAVTFNPKGALKGGIVGGIVGGLLPKKIQLKTPAQMQAQRVAWADSTFAKGADQLSRGDLAGANATLAELYRMAGMLNPGKFGGSAQGAATQKARDYIYEVYKQLKAGIDAGPAIVAVPSPMPGTPAPAPTSGTVDVTGASIPPSIMQASASQPAVGVNASSAPTASEQVAAAVQAEQTAETVQAGTMPSFDLGALKDPKVLLTLAGLGIFLMTQTGSKRRRRRR